MNMILGCDCTQFVERNACADKKDDLVQCMIFFIWLFAWLNVHSYFCNIMENGSGAKTAN